MAIVKPKDAVDLDPPALVISPHSDDYPRALRVLEQPPKLTLSGPLDASRRVVAIVGSRNATESSRTFAFQLAFHLARANVIVVSGGAVGVDRSAHEGALKAGGLTWVVACAGRGWYWPEKHTDLFRHVEASSTSRMIWPFPDWTKKDRHTPRDRNKVLVGLAECVVIIQARLASGSRNAARLAGNYGRRLFVVPAAPWDDAFGGGAELLVSGEAEPLWSIGDLFSKLGLRKPDLDEVGAVLNGKGPPKLNVRQKAKRPIRFSEPPFLEVNRGGWSHAENVVFSRLSMAPTQQDEIIAKTGLGTSSTVTALLTLSLKDVVVEGPDGFFRRRTTL